MTDTREFTDLLNSVTAYLATASAHTRVDDFNTAIAKAGELEAWVQQKVRDFDAAQEAANAQIQQQAAEIKAQNDAVLEAMKTHILAATKIIELHGKRDDARAWARVWKRKAKQTRHWLNALRQGVIAADNGAATVVVAGDQVVIKYVAQPAAQRGPDCPPALLDGEA
jgi:hypothetical protein